MLAADAVRKLSVGRSVAEQDNDLTEYFVETSIFDKVINDQVDIVAGDKGSGKSAIFRILHEKYRSFPTIDDVEMIPAFNLTGSTVFDRFSQLNEQSERAYAVIWKTYFLALIGNYILDVCESMYSENLQKLRLALEALEVRSQDPSAPSVFTLLVNRLKRLASPSSLEATISLAPAGLPSVAWRTEYREFVDDVDNVKRIISISKCMEILDRCVNDLDLRIWVPIDRLDEAFAATPEIEIPALRALLRTYLDSKEYPRIRFKMFLRNDLFRRISETPFVNLTHIHSAMVDISWIKDDLFALICDRLRNSQYYREHILCLQSNDEIFYCVFPLQIDRGDRKPTTWNWITNRLTDGNNRIAPRNLIDLVSKAIDAQSRRDAQTRRAVVLGEPLLEPVAVRTALEQVSELRVQDTLIAENGHIGAHVQSFYGGKANHTKETLSAVLSLSGIALENAVSDLQKAGFLGREGDRYIIPMMYRSGLKITQGKATPSPASQTPHPP